LAVPYVNICAINSSFGTSCQAHSYRLTNLVIFPSITDACKEDNKIPGISFPLAGKILC
jgi:hypothetical protein